MDRVIGAVLGGMVWAGAAGAQIQPTHQDVVYANVGGEDLLLDLYMPPGATDPVPIVVWIHGGGWASGSKDQPGGVFALNSQGIAVASINYRLTTQEGEWGDAPVTWPAQLHDVKGAVRFLRANAAEYGIDGVRIGCWGSSAGGHLSSMLAVTGNTTAFLEGTTGGNTGIPSDVRAAADYYGPSDLLNMDLDVTDPPGSMIEHDAPESPESKLVAWDQPGQGIGDIRDNLTNPIAPYPMLRALVRDASPLRLVTHDDAPLFVSHGTVDTSVPFNQSVHFVERLEEAGVPVEFLPVEGAGHGGLGPAANAGAVAHLVRYLVELPPMCATDVDRDCDVDVEDAYALATSPRDVDGDLLVSEKDQACLGAFLRRDELGETR